MKCFCKLFHTLTFKIHQAIDTFDLADLHCKFSRTIRPFLQCKDKQINQSHQICVNPGRSVYSLNAKTRERRLHVIYKKPPSEMKMANIFHFAFFHKLFSSYSWKQYLKIFSFKVFFYTFTKPFCFIFNVGNTISNSQFKIAIA